MAMPGRQGRRLASNRAGASEGALWLPGGSALGGGRAAVFDVAVVGHCGASAQQGGGDGDQNNTAHRVPRVMLGP